MDQGLFGKYFKIILKQKNEVDEIINFIKNETGIIFNTNEILVQKNKIIFQTSSVKKTILKNKKIKEFLDKRGYIYKF